MSDQLIVERGGLEKKEKGELQAIILALGGTSSSRARKSELIDLIMELSGATEIMGSGPSATDQADGAGDVSPGDADADGDGSANGEASHRDPTTAREAEVGSEDRAAAGHDPAPGRSEPGASSDDGASRPVRSSWVAETDEIDESAAVRSPGGGLRTARATRPRSEDRSPTGTARPEAESNDDRSPAGEQANPGARQPAADRNRADDRPRPDDRTGRDSANRLERDSVNQDDAPRAGAGRDDRSRSEARADRQPASRQSANRTDRPRADERSGGRGSSDYPVGPDGEPLADWELAMLPDGNQAGDRSQNRGQDRTDGTDDVDPNNRRSRRRGRGRGRERDEAPFETVPTQPIGVSGVLDLRDEGYGFLRVDGCLPSKDDVYVSVKQVRQYGLRKGDVITGLSRPANRNEKNPGFHQIDTVNDLPADEGRNRVRFDDLTPLFPDQRLRLEMKDEPLNMTTRIIDLVAPIGKGQRALIVSPPKAGKTTVIKDITRAIETNNPEVELIVLLLDERPEEVTDMSRHLNRGHVVASTFDRPPEEHCAVAELTIERAKRLVEAGQDVCLVVDGITRLSRAYNLSAPQTGRAMSGGLDAGALYPPKRFFGAARNLEEGGSLTILATALVETGSRMDEVIFEEFKGTGNCEIRLDRRLAEKRLFPAIDIDGSSTRHEELLFDRQQLQAAWKLRRVLSAMGSDDGSSAAAVEMLVDRLKTFKTNADFLNEIVKSPSL